MTALDRARASLFEADPRLRVEALRTLAAHGGPCVIAEILALCHDRDPFVRGTVCQALGMLGEGVAVDMLAPALHDADARTRSEAVHALEACGLRSAAVILIPMLADPEPVVRIQVAQTLATWRHAGAGHALEARIALERRAEVRAALFHARLALPEAQEFALLLRSETRETQQGALRCLSRCGWSADGELLAYFLQSPDAGTRSAAAAALAYVDTPDPDFLLACTADGAPDVIAGVLAALVDFAEPGLLQLARAQLTRADARMLGPAIHYIGRHGDEADIAALQRIAGNAPGGDADAAGKALALIEGTTEVAIADPLPSGPDADSAIALLAGSGQAAQRSRAGMIQIANDRVGPRAALAILDRARARGDADAAGVLVALSLCGLSSVAAQMRRTVQCGAVSRWEQLAHLAGKMGLRWIGPARGRLAQPLHAGGEIAAQTLLLRLAMSTAARAVRWQAGAIGAGRVGQAADEARQRLVAHDPG